MAGLISPMAGGSNSVWSNQLSVPETSRTALVHDVRVTLTEIAPIDLASTSETRCVSSRTRPKRFGSC